jgi:alpha-glucuronidase
VAGAAHHLYLGEIPATAPAAEATQLRDEVENLREDGFVIRSMGPDVVILGKGSRGILYGCYAFLERQGVRWYFPGKQ